MVREPERASAQDFRVLGLKPGSLPAEVKKAYREQVKLWHPDFFQQRPNAERQRAEDRLKEITTAYRRISRQWKSQGAPKEEQAAERPKETVRKPKGPARPSATRNRPAGPRFSPGAAMESGRAFIQRLLRKRPSSVTWRSVGSLAILFVLIWAATSMHLTGWMGPRPSRPPAPQRSRPPMEMPEVPQASSPNPQGPLQSASEQPSATSPPPTAPPDARRKASPASPAIPSSTITLGSSETEVLLVQGLPSRVRGETWVYGLSEIQFKEGRLWRYNNFDGSLKVQLDPTPSEANESPTFFTLGSVRDDVLRVQGTPTRVDGNKWYYGFSEVRFKDDRVESYDNYFGNLSIRLMPSNPSALPSSGGHFTIGSTRDEVLAIQGTPTSIQGNLWFYRLSNVLFRNGRVQHVVNSDGNLRFASAAAPGGRAAGKQGGPGKE